MIPEYGTRPAGIEETVASIIQLIIAVVLLCTGVLHFVQPYVFLQTITSYELLPRWSLFPAAVLIPVLQIAVAIVLLFGQSVRSAATLALLIFIVFSIAQLSVLIRGINIDCGCFGTSFAEVSYSSLSIPVLMGGGCFYILYRDKLSTSSPNA